MRGSGALGTLVSGIVAATYIDQGATTVVRAGTVELIVARLVGAAVEAGQTLTWAGSEPAVLAGARLT